MKKKFAPILTVIIFACSIVIFFATKNTKPTDDINNNKTTETIGTTAMPTEPATKATEPATKATEPATKATEPATQPTEPTTEKSEPTTVPTEPKTEPTTVAPTKPATEPTTKAPTEPTTVRPSATPNSLEIEILNLVNEERAKVGLAPLEFGYFYYDAAKLRAKEVDVYLSHTRPDGTSCETVFNELGICLGHRKFGENAAAYFSDAKVVVDAWMNSPGHKRNILDEDFSYLAVATYESEKWPGNYAIEQLFLSN